MITEILFIALVMVQFALLGITRIAASIRLVALQGMLLGLLTLVFAVGQVTGHRLFIAVSNFAIKGFIIPWLLARAVRNADVRQDAIPFVGPLRSLAIGIVLLGFTLWLSMALNLPVTAAGDLALPVALFMIMTGLLLIISQRIAATQALGYLVMENGIFLFGVAFVGEIPFLVELGTLLDAFVAIFVMGIAIHHISSEFDHMETDQLSVLKG